MGGGAVPECEYPGKHGVGFSNGIFYNNSAVKIASISDGTSNVFMVGETRYIILESYDPWHWGTWASGYYWGKYPMYVTCVAALWNINSSDLDPAKDETGGVFPRTFGSHHPGGCQFVMADGSVHFVDETIDPATYRRLAARNDGLPIGGSAP